MDALAQIRRDRLGVTLLGASAPGGVTFAFTCREGGVSQGAYASLNLGDACGDDPASVAANRARALDALGAGADALPKLISCKQVHGDTVVVLKDEGDEALARAQAQAAGGADAIVVCVPGVPALICVADCCPVAIAGSGGYALVHSGWKGTIARIAAKAARELAACLGCAASELSAVIGPCIRKESYKVSQELASRFEAEFGEGAVSGCKLDLPYCVASALKEAGLDASRIEDARVDSFADEGYFSFRRQEGVCGRQGLLAYIAKGGAA